MSIKAICLIGPTGSGKTSVAFSLARNVKGEVVNLDKIYTYKNFPISTGLSDSLKEKGVKRHLYQLLTPAKTIISPKKYAKMIRKVCIEISQKGKVPIIEGGSTTYFPALYEENKKKIFIGHFVGLKLPKNIDLSAKIEKRVSIAIGEDLLKEIRMGIKKYPNSLIMKDCHFVVPMVRYLKGDISLKLAKKEVVERCLGYIKRQMKCFLQYKDIKWIEHNSSKPAVTINEIDKLLRG